MVANQSQQEPLKRVQIKMTRSDPSPSHLGLNPPEPVALTPGNVIDAAILAKAHAVVLQNRSKPGSGFGAAAGDRGAISPLNLKEAARDPQYQGKVVDCLLEQGFVPETIQYAVDYEWWTRWRAWTRSSRLQNDRADPPGRVTNERLLKLNHNPNISLSKGEEGRRVYGVDDVDERFEENKDYLFVPAEVWEALNCMNGGRGVAIVKEVDGRVDALGEFPQYALPEDPSAWNTKWDQKYGIPSRPHPKYKPRKEEEVDDENIMEVDSEDVLDEFRSGRRQIRVCIGCLSKDGESPVLWSVAGQMPYLRCCL